MGTEKSNFERFKFAGTIFLIILMLFSFFSSSSGFYSPENFYLIGNLPVFSSSHSVDYDKLEKVRVSGENYFSVSDVEGPREKVSVDQKFSIAGEVICEVHPGCKNVRGHLTLDGDVIDKSGDLRLVDSEDVLKDCGDLKESESCVLEWNLRGRSPGDYYLRLEFNDSGGTLEKSERFDISVAEVNEFLNIEGISISGSNSKRLFVILQHNNSVYSDIRCILNSDQEDKCVLENIGPGGGVENCTMDYPGYQTSNLLSCEMRNGSNHIVRDLEFSMEGDITHADLTQKKYLIEDKKDVKARCLVYNLGDIVIKGGRHEEGVGAINFILESPKGKKISKRIFLEEDIGLKEKRELEEIIMLPRNAENGTWIFRCSNFRLKDTLTMRKSSEETKFIVSNKSYAGVLNLTILEPREGEEVSRGERIELKARLTGSKGERIEEALVTANGVTLQSKEGVYYGILTVPRVISDRYDIDITAESKEHVRDIEKVSLDLEDDLKISYELDKKEYRKGETLKIQGELLNPSKHLDNPNIMVKLYNPDSELKRTSTPFRRDHVFSDSFLLETNYTTGNWSVRVEIKDGESIGLKEKHFKLKPSLRGGYYFRFLMPEKRSRERGSKIPLEIKAIDAITGDEVDLENVSCEFSNREIEVDKEGNHYKGIYTIFGSSDLGVNSLECRGFRKESNGYLKHSNSILMNVLLLELDLSILNPSKSQFKADGKIRFGVNVSHEGEPVENASLVLYLNGRRTSIRLNETGKEGIYKSNYTVSREINSFSFKATDQEGNTGFSEVREVKTSGYGGPDLLFFLKIFLASILIITSLYIFYYYLKEYGEEKLNEEKRLRERKDKLRDILEDLRIELDSVESSRQETQRKYYKREIDEKTFKQMMQNYEIERTELKNKIEQVKEELENVG